MERRTWVVLSILVIALAGGFAFSRLLGPALQNAGLQIASDAPRIKGTISVAGDNYLGYWFLTSREFTNRLRQQGYLIRWTNDEGSYAERLRNFASNRYDVIVLPINSYLFHGLAHRYPGVIAVALSESRGADSILGYTEKVAGAAGRPASINDLNNPGLKICVTPDSPSQFLLEVAISHFALDGLKAKGPWNVATRGSEDGFAKLRGRQCDVAVVWEPDVSKALSLPGVATIFGSDQVAEMIIDVFVLRRQWLADQPEMADAFFQSYFETLAFYAAHRDDMLLEIAKDPAFGSRAAAQSAINRIAWFGLEENCRDWFNVGPSGAVAASREKLVDAIGQVTSVMVDVGDLAKDPLDRNPYLITNSEVLKRLCSTAGGLSSGIGASPNSGAFSSLTPDEWARLRSVGRLRALPISFDPSTARLTSDGGRLVDQVGTSLSENYPRYRVLVKGHTAPAGDEGANLALSEQRAEAVKSYLMSARGIDPNRLLAVGAGSGEPLPRLAGEGELAYRNRLARVEFVLLEANR